MTRHDGRQHQPHLQKQAGQQPSQPCRADLLHVYPVILLTVSISSPIFS